MNLTGFSLKNPYVVLALIFAVAALGAFAFFRTPTDLFPNTVPPQVLVVTIEPGASARDVSDRITQVIEKELNTLTGLKRITSTSRDQVSSINAEFYYDKPGGEAVQDVQNAISRIQSDLPKEILDPRIYRITDATRPLITLALSPALNSVKTLSDIRFLAENRIMDEILSLPYIADVDVFGSHKPEVKVLLQRDRLAANKISLGEVLGVLVAQNITIPAGTIYSRSREYLVKTTGEFTDLQQIRDLPLVKKAQGYLRIKDLGEVFLGEHEQRSLYHGNGRPAVAVNVLRQENGPTTKAIRTFKKLLPRLKAQYPDIRFEITNDQAPIIDVNVHGMRQSLIQAMILTVLVIFLFLADLRAAMVVSVSIPLAFLTTLVVLWFSPYTLNMVTLTGLIISVGLVVDSSVVVLENIFRHYRAMEQPDGLKAARNGVSEVALAITAGMLTTVIVLIPVMFSGGHTQQVMRPLILMISSTLVASLLVALTVIPLMASRLLSGARKKPTFVERIFGRTDKGVTGLASLYLAVLRRAIRWPIITLIIAAAFFVATMKVVPPLIGSELMTPMDTGIAIVEFDTPTDYNIEAVEQVLNRVERMIYDQPGNSLQGIETFIGQPTKQFRIGAADNDVQGRLGGGYRRGSVLADAEAAHARRFTQTLAPSILYSPDRLIALRSVN